MLSNERVRDRVATISHVPGLVAFWSFEDGGNRDVVSRYDPNLGMTALPFLLGRIGDVDTHAITRWPYVDGAARLHFPDGGPFGRSIRLNQGHVYGIIPRQYFDATWLDINRRQSFTMVAWLRFTGERHLVGGIWDEGGWNPYGGRRQVALFGGLFKQPGVIAHVSATGAACYPQSIVDGAQYARTRAIDGAPIEQSEWVSIAMTFDPVSDRVTAYKNGVASPTSLPDAVMVDAIGEPKELSTNPIFFSDSIFHPEAPLLKFSGFDYKNGPVREHMLAVDFTAGFLRYQKIGRQDAPSFRVKGIITTRDIVEFEVDDTRRMVRFTPASFGRISASLEVLTPSGWGPAANDLFYEVLAGAPFTFGRALGVGDHGLDFGSQLDLAGFAVFNRTLTPDDLVRIACVE